MEPREDATTYDVVINSEEQYSIWPADREPPIGWRAVGVTASKDECLTHIEQRWTDMRPLSVRQQMHGGAADQPAETPAGGWG